MNNGLYLIQGSPAVEENYNVLLLDIERLKKESYIDVNTEDKFIRVAAFTVQDLIIEKILGTCLYKNLKKLVCEKNITMPIYSTYYDLVNDYLYPVFMYAILADLNIPVTYKIRNAGNVQTASDTLAVTSNDDINYVSKHYATKRDSYIKRAVDFIRCRKEFHSCTCGKCGCGEPGLEKSYQVNFSLK